MGETMSSEHSNSFNHVQTRLRQDHRPFFDYLFTRSGPFLSPSLTHFSRARHFKKVAPGPVLEMSRIARAGSDRVPIFSGPPGRPTARPTGGPADRPTVRAARPPDRLTGAHSNGSRHRRSGRQGRLDPPPQWSQGVNGDGIRSERP